jgi:hypothetical protein
VKKLYEKNSSIYVARECRNFLAEFAVKVCSSNKEVAEEILKSALDVLSSNKTDKTGSLDLLVSALELSLKLKKPEVSLLVEKQLTAICEEHFKMSSLDNPTLNKIAQLQLLLIFCTVEEQKSPVKTLEEKSLNLIVELIHLKNIAAIQFVTFQCQVYWKILKPRVSHLVGECGYDMQILYIQVVI